MASLHALNRTTTKALALAFAATIAAAGSTAGCGSSSSTPGGGAGTNGAGGSGGPGGAGGPGGSGAGPDGGVPDAPLVTPTEACLQLAAAVCDALDDCATVALTYLYIDKATCVARQQLGCMNDQMIPGITRTVDDILLCKRDVTAASCSNLVASKLPDSCLVKPGAGALGAVCGSDWQCASTYCKKDTTACGTCANRAGAGAACTADAGCQTGLVCANSVCVTPGSVAQACDGNHPCRGDLYCTNKIIGGSCQQKVGAGSSCADADTACDLTKSVGCNPFNHMCEPFAVATGGNQCGVINGELTLCVDLGPCAGANLLQPKGVCANTAADDAPCGDAANGVVCLPPATCQAGVCRLPSIPTCL